jgi:hypothetical protein
MSQRGDLVTFGQRTGAVGIGAIVELKRHGSTYQFAGSGGCGPVGYRNGQTAIDLGSYTVHGTALTIHYEGGNCDSRPPDVVAHQRATTIDVLVVSPPPLKTSVACAGSGQDDTVTVTLKSALGHRAIRDIGYVPARSVPRQAA